MADVGHRLRTVDISLPSDFSSAGQPGAYARLFANATLVMPAATPTSLIEIRRSALHFAATTVLAGAACRQDVDIAFGSQNSPAPAPSAAPSPPSPPAPSPCSVSFEAAVRALRLSTRIQAHFPVTSNIDGSLFVALLSVRASESLWLPRLGRGILGAIAAQRWHEAHMTAEMEPSSTHPIVNAQLGRAWAPGCRPRTITRLRGHQVSVIAPLTNPEKEYLDFIASKGYQTVLPLPQEVRTFVAGLSSAAPVLVPQGVRGPWMQGDANNSQCPCKGKDSASINDDSDDIDIDLELSRCKTPSPFPQPSSSSDGWCTAAVVAALAHPSCLRIHCAVEVAPAVPWTLAAAVGATVARVRLAGPAETQLWSSPVPRPHTARANSLGEVLAKTASSVLKLPWRGSVTGGVLAPNPHAPPRAAAHGVSLDAQLRFLVAAHLSGQPAGFGFDAVSKVGASPTDGTLSLWAHRALERLYGVNLDCFTLPNARLAVRIIALCRARALRVSQGVPNLPASTVQEMARAIACSGVQFLSIDPILCGPLLGARRSSSCKGGVGAPVAWMARLPLTRTYEGVLEDGWCKMVRGLDLATVSNCLSRAPEIAGRALALASALGPQLRGLALPPTGSIHRFENAVSLLTAKQMPRLTCLVLPVGPGKRAPRYLRHRLRRLPKLQRLWVDFRTLLALQEHGRPVTEQQATPAAADILTRSILRKLHLHTFYGAALGPRTACELARLGSQAPATAWGTADVGFLAALPCNTPKCARPETWVSVLGGSGCVRKRIFVRMPGTRADLAMSGVPNDISEGILNIRDFIFTTDQ